MPIQPNPLFALILACGLTGSAIAQTPATGTKPLNAPMSKQAAVAKGKSGAPAKATPPAPVLPEASEEQMAAIERAYLGTYDCEFNQSISITRNSKQGYLDVMWQKFVLTMKPVLSSTGALRLEDVTGRTLMIQIANKSMLMDTHAGRRLVDECIHPEQRAAIEAARAARAAAIASGEPAAPQTGLGIAPKQ